MFFLFNSDVQVRFLTLGGERKMKCPKCKGRMYTEKYFDYVRSYQGWKCSCCGEMLDATIIANRARNQNHYLG